MILNGFIETGYQRIHIFLFPVFFNHLDCVGVSCKVISLEVDGNCFAFALRCRKIVPTAGLLSVIMTNRVIISGRRHFC